MADRLARTARILICVVFAIAFARTAAAQGENVGAPAVLVANEIFLTADRRLVARGSVEAFQNTTRLTASAITYDPQNETLRIDGPITIDSGQGTVILASQAEMSRDLQNGLLKGARLVFDNQLQLASVQMNRTNGRYTQLYRTAVTSCRICENDTRPPLWQIRARRVIHDEQERQIYFDDAQLLWRNTPIFYWPRLRFPDPTLDRATGFLFPEVFSNSRLGTGVKVPYFIRLGPHRDLTLTPVVSNQTRTLELRYRQAFRTGAIQFEGAVSRDELQSDDRRGYLFGVGSFDLPRDFVLQFDLELVSDDSYLTDYGYSGKDRLDSELRLSRARRDEYIQLSYININSLRDDEVDDFLPTDIVEAFYERRFFPAMLGGEIRLATTAHAHARRSNDGNDSNSDGIADGRDVTRIGLDALWRRSGLLGAVHVSTELGFAADYFDIQQDNVFAGTYSEVTPRAAVTLRYPLSKVARSGATIMFEPIMQLAWSGGDGLAIPNEESTEVEFDEGNLLAFSRFPASDRRERGWAVSLGASWSRYAPSGNRYQLTFGQIIRQDAQSDFSETSGLSGTKSDYLVAAQFQFFNGLSVTGRTLFNQQFDIAKSEFRGGWRNERLSLAASYVWVSEDPFENRFDDINELTFDGSVEINDFWSANLDFRYDLTKGRAATAEAGLVYSNECVRVAATLSRNFANSTTVDPSTNLGISVRLQGFSSQSGGKRQVRSCS